MITSRYNHVVPPSASYLLAASVAGPVERVWLERSYHVATVDYDHEEVERRAVAFARKAFGSDNSSEAPPPGSRLGGCA